MVRVFDGSRRTVIGEIDLPMKIGPHIFFITLFVMDILRVQLSARETMDSFRWSRHFNVPPGTEICSEQQDGSGGRQGRFSGKPSGVVPLY